MSRHVFFLSFSLVFGVWCLVFGVWCLLKMTETGVESLLYAFRVFIHIVTRVSSVLPSAAADYEYLRVAFGDRLAFSYSFCTFFVRAAGSEAFACITMARYVYFAVVPNGSHQSDDDIMVEKKAIALGATIAVVALNCFRLSFVSKIMNGLAMLKMVLVALLVGVAVIALSRSTDVLETNFEHPFSGVTAGGIGTGMVAVMWACGGYSHVAFMVEEMRDPARDLAPSIVSASIIVTTAYIMCLLSYFAVLTNEDQMTTSVVASDAVKGIFGDIGGRIASFFVAISVLGSIFCGVMSTGRFIFATARDGQFPNFLKTVSPRGGVPYVAVLAYGAWCMVLLSLPGATLSTILMFVAFIDWWFDTLVTVALIRIRYLLPDAHRPFKMPLYPLPAIVVLVAGIGMMTATASAHPIPTAASFSFFLLSFPVHYFFIRRPVNRETVGGGESAVVHDNENDAADAPERLLRSETSLLIDANHKSVAENITYGAAGSSHV